MLGEMSLFKWPRHSVAGRPGSPRSRRRDVPQGNTRPLSAPQEAGLLAERGRPLSRL